MASDHRYTIELRDRYLRVAQFGTLPSLEAAVAMHQAIERVLERLELRRAMFDNRGTEPPAEDVRVAQWSWVTDAERFERVALLFKSDLTAVRVNMTSLSRRAHVKGFTDEAAAAAWLDK
jgi:hypothetical protein